MEPATKIPTPTALILLGATGDLAQKKLLPALIDLFEKGVLPEHFYILAYSRRPLSTEEYRSFARTHIETKNKQYDAVLFDKFLTSIEYVQGQFDEAEGYERVKEALERYDARIGMCSSKLFYLAVPPTYYDSIFNQLTSFKLEQQCVVGIGWTRILVEKPFGNDLHTARLLDEKLNTLFREEQIYRIDHYLAKDALQNIIAFRFSNVLFEDKWNNEFVEAVHIKLFEKFDVQSRGSFYDAVGALRDVGQNHILQMLALIAMEHPEKLEATMLREKRALVFESLRIPTEEDFQNHVVKGQYHNYHRAPGTTEDSKTETYFVLKTFIDTTAWQGVPFYLEHGKALTESATEITVRFRPSKNCVCNDDVEQAHPNFIRFSISPEQKIMLRFWVRKKGLQYELEPEDLVFDRNHAVDKKSLFADAYEGVLYDALRGDQTLFVSTREQEAAWHYITAILDLWKDLTPVEYEQGTTGPDSVMKKEIQDLLEF
jgi:glucose-6-phosphate 1-dehydrogenase